MTKAFEYTGRDLEVMSGAENYHRHILDQFKPYLGKRVVEVGAGDGSFSELISECEIDSLVAIEPSQNMYNLLAKKLTSISRTHTEFHHGFLGDVADNLIEHPPDSFIYVNVFEHIREDEAEMQRVWRLLKPGGHLLMFVPALPRLYSRFDKAIEHFRRYTLSEAKQKAIAAGFRVHRARYFDWLGILPWWIRFKLLRASSLSPRAVKLYDKFGVPIIRVTESVLAPPVGKNVLLIAQKP